MNSQDILTLIIVNVLGTVIIYKIICKNPQNTLLLTILLFVSILMTCISPAFSTLPAFFIAGIIFDRIRKKTFWAVWNEIKIAPSEILVNQFMEGVNKYGLENNPKAWNELRGVWFVVNDCPNIPTAKKTEFRNLLMTKGLKLVGNDKDIIDNYKG